MYLSGDVPPNQTIYIKNLNEKLKKDELKRALYCLFSQFGRIVDVVALKTPRLRGQAWICFSEITAASNAVRQMQNFPFYDKPFRIQFAKSQSECIAKLDENYDPRDSKKKKLDDTAEKKRRTDEGQQASGAYTGTAAHSNGGSTAPQRKPGGQEAAAAPNNILFVQNLPHDASSSELQRLFQQYPGFREVRLIASKPGIAFVDFEDENQSTVVMQALQGFKIDAHHLIEISYAKK